MKFFLIYIFIIASFLICAKDYINFLPVFVLGMIAMYLAARP